MKHKYNIVEEFLTLTPSWSFSADKYRHAIIGAPCKKEVYESYQPEIWQGCKQSEFTTFPTTESFGNCQHLEKLGTEVW